MLRLCRAFRHHARAGANCGSKKIGGRSGSGSASCSSASPYLKSGASLRWLAVLPGKWSTLSQVGADLAANWLRFVAQFGFWLVVFSFALSALGFRAREFIARFRVSLRRRAGRVRHRPMGSASYYNLEPPLLALLVGLVISNFIGLPHWLDAGFRVEFYIKTGIVLLGATVPFSLVASRRAGGHLAGVDRFDRYLPGRSILPRSNWVLIGASPPRSARAAPCAASPAPSLLPARSAPSASTRRSPSPP